MPIKANHEKVGHVERDPGTLAFVKRDGEVREFKPGKKSHQIGQVKPIPSEKVAYVNKEGNIYVRPFVRRNGSSVKAHSRKRT